jgi:putative tryptophan/tyrosine transport system substrate-binding protein
MDRRRFLVTSLSGALAVPLVAGAQPAGKIPRVGFVEAGSRSANQHFADAFRAGLHELGYVEGQNIAVDERWAEGRIERFPDLLADLLRLKVDAIIQASGPGAVAAKNITTTVPVVFVGVSDPVALGLVESLARPGDNLTGLSLAFTEGFAGKWVDLFTEAVPRASRVAVLSNPLYSRNEGLLREMQAAGMGGLIVLTDPLTLRYRARVVELAATRRLPAVYGFGEFAQAGGLMAYGPSVREMFRRAATYVDKILKGAKPGDLPVEQPTKFELVINLKTANALGLTIPPSVLLRADQVIDP